MISRTAKIYWKIKIKLNNNLLKINQKKQKN